jgi:hypothetical protein
MTRILNRPADVTTGQGGVPIAFRSGRSRHRVESVLDRWVETGRWWEQETEQVTFRVATEDGGIYELTWRSEPKQWVLYRAYD